MSAMPVAFINKLMIALPKFMTNENIVTSLKESTIPIQKSNKFEKR